MAAPAVTTPLLLRRRWTGPGYRQIRCALCYLRFWPWQKQVRGANYFPHPYMRVHPLCGRVYVEMRRRRHEAQLREHLGSIRQNRGYRHMNTVEANLALRE
jgi:hypothetical protein